MNRTQKSLKNIVVGIFSQIITIVLNFIGRTVFIRYLGVEYLGLNGLFTNILTILSLAELGIGNAMIYSLYKPLAQKNKEEASALMNFYSQVYIKIALLVLILGSFLIPFLSKIVKSNFDNNFLLKIYILFLANSVLSYLLVYKRSIVIADQKEYILSKIKLILGIIKLLFQVGVLFLFKSFTLYLLIQISITILENTIISYQANKIYPFLKMNKNKKLQKSKINEIWRNVKSLIIYKFGAIILDGTDNIIISMLIGVSFVGELSNYTLVIGAVMMLANQITNSITSSVGNFVITESKKKQEELLEVLNVGYFLIYCTISVYLYSLLNPFIELWLGRKYILSQNIVLVLIINTYIYGMLNDVWTFRNTLGLFKYGRYRPFISAVVNIIMSILLAKHTGLVGVLLGTTLTRVFTNIWYDPLIVYKYGLNKSPKRYYIISLKNIFILFLNLIIIEKLKKNIIGVNIFNFIKIASLCSVVLLINFVMYYRKNSSMIYLIKKIKKRI